MEKQANGGANRWISTAAEEIRQIEKRWGFTSIRQFSKFLQMNPRTLSKLPHHDGTLTLESIANIYTRLILLRNLKFVGTELKEEEQLLKDSLFRIMMSAATVPQTLRADVVDELENQLSLPCGPIPHKKPGEGSDAPPTLERSG